MAHNRELSQFANAIGYNGGNIGIGTDNPGEKLVVQGSVVCKGTLSAGQTSAGVLDFSGNDLRIRCYGATTGSGAFSIRTGGGAGNVDTERLRITSAGRLLVGGATVEGAPAADNLTLEDSGSCGLTIRAGTSDYSSIYLSDATSGTGEYASFLQYGHADNSLRIGTNSVERLCITSAGRMGLGYNAPDTMGTGRLVIGNGSGSETLTIFSSSTTNGNIHFADGTSGQDRYRGYITYHHNDGTNANYMAFGTNDVERLRITSDGKIGIGEDSPDGLLVIKGDSNGASNPSIRLKDGTDTREAWITNASGDLILANGGDDNTPHCKITMFDANIFSLETANTERLRVHATGEVTKSTQPRFWARLSTSTTYNPSGFGNYIDFDLEEYDIGGNFQTSGSDQGLFIAPVAGMYQFSASAYCVGQALTQSWFVVNNSRKNGTDWVLSTTANFTQNFQMIYLNVGDKVGFHPHKGGTSSFSIVNNVHHTYFKGCLLG